MQSLSTRQIADFRGLLVRRHKELEAEIQAKLAETREERVGFDGAISTDGGDGPSVTASADLHRAEVERDIAELRDVEAAQRRIEDGGFGICKDCAEPISLERLQAWPVAKRCAGCQRKHELASAPRPSL